MDMPALKKIMIVDDEQSILLSLSHVLKAERVEVITCNEIEQAEAALENTHFDLVIADIRMSGVNGIEGLELLSYIKDRFETKVIIMTGHGSDDTRKEAYRRGACYYFQKPVDIPELLKQVSAAGIPVKNSWLRPSQNTTL
jgi:DNA-binding NtrC family response regulator